MFVFLFRKLHWLSKKKCQDRLNEHKNPNKQFKLAKHAKDFPDYKMKKFS